MRKLKNLVKKVNRKGFELLYASAYGLGIVRPSIRDTHHLVLCYHGIDLVGNTQINSRFISQCYFEQQLQYFKTHFRILSLKDFFATPKQVADQFTITLTFDDGYRNNFKYVLPLLEKYEIPATFFITGIIAEEQEMLWTDFYDLATFDYHLPLEVEGKIYQKNSRGKEYHCSQRNQSLKRLCLESDFSFIQKVMQAFPQEALKFKDDPKWDDYWQQMNKPEIRKLSQSPYVTIGCHGYFHDDLSKIPIQAALEQLQKNKSFLENITQQEILALAYPFGNYNIPLVQAAEKIGFEHQLALEYLSFEKHPRLKDRFGMNSYLTWPNQLRYLVRGDYVKVK